MTTQIEIDAKNFAKGCRAVLAVADKLAKIDNLEQAVAKAQKELGDARLAADEAQVKYQETQDGLNVALESVVIAQKQTVDIIADAESNAKTMLDEASSKSTQMIENAETEVVNHRRYVRVENERHKERMTKNDAKYAEVTEKLSTLNTELAALRKRIA